MVKRLFLLIAFATMAIGGFAQSEKSAAETVVNEVINTVKNAPSGTTYGIVESTPEKYVVNTPVGKYDVEKKGKNEYSVLGINIKVDYSQKKKGVYTLDTSLGKFQINIKKISVRKLL